MKTLLYIKAVRTETFFGKNAMRCTLSFLFGPRVPSSNMEGEVFNMKAQV